MPYRPRPSIFSPSRVVVLALGLLAAAPVASAQTTVQAVAVEPAEAVTGEPLVVTVDLVTCAAQPAGIAVTSEPGVGRFLDVRLAGSCLVTPPPQVAVRFVYDPVFVGADIYTLRVVTYDPDSDENVGTLWEQPLTVFRPSDFVLELPDAPVTDVEPVAIRVTGEYGCGGTRFVGLDGDVVELEWERCAALVADEVRSEIVEIDPLPAGDYRIRLTEDELGPGPGLATLPFRVHPADRCLPDAGTLCLQDGRFQVRGAWMDFQGGAGIARAIPLPDRDDTGMFWFFAEDNVELTVKVLDGCGVNGHHWVFLSPGSTAGWEVTVTDLVEDGFRTYRNETGDTPPLTADTAAFPHCP